MTNDSWILAVAVVLVVFVPFDWYVAAKFIAVARQRPYIRVLTLAALRSTAIAIAATLAAILGVQSIWFYWTGVRLLPTPIPAILIAVALVVISLPNLYALRLLDEGDQ